MPSWRKQGNYLGHVPRSVYNVNVHIEQASPRAWHAVEQVLGSLLGWQVVRVPSADELERSVGPKLVYGTREVGGAMRITPCGWLSETGIREIDPPVTEIDGMTVLFPVKEGTFGSDPFAAAFFSLTRYEEWVGIPKDQHDRPVTVSLHGARHGYLHRPVVDEWALRLAAVWRELDPNVPLPQRQYRQVITVDLDNGLKYLGRPLWRSFGSLARDVIKGERAEVAERVRVLQGKAQDPFVIDDDVFARFRDAADRIIFFVLVAPRGEWDHAVPVDHPAYAPVLNALAKRAEVGLHPSYFSSDKPGTSAVERDRLQAIIGNDVTKTRQHFLKLRIPETLRELERIGIKEEHSLGIHDRLGFRSGTCTPYHWYDLEQERSTSLMIHPFTVMDNTLRDKLRLDPRTAVDEVRPLIDAVKRVRGTFTGLWHESFLASTGPNIAWRHAILEIIEKAKA